MIDLTARREPRWLDLGHGVRIEVRPCSTAMFMAARSDVGRERESGEPAQALLVRAVGRRAIIAWQGVALGDEPAAVTAENVDAMLDLYPLAEAFERLYLGPALLLEDSLDAEKNALPPSPDGTTAAGQPIAEAAG